MAVTLIKQPIGHKLSDSEVTAQIIDDGQGNALVYTGFAHALSDGDYVYIESNMESYNGFKYVDSISYDGFKIKESENGDYVQFIKDESITYRVSVLNHGWQGVHLPIVYELESDIYPTNTGEEAYTPIEVVSQSDDGGYTRLELNAALTDPTELAKIQIVGFGGSTDVFQIITVYQPWSITIDLPYSASNGFTDLQIVKYYDNYAINVRVYAGVSSTHRWASIKPFELATTLRFIPDADNRVKFSIAEVLRAYIKTRNNLTLDTLPNNLDFCTAFYIQYFESYDSSNGDEVTTFEGSVTTDNFTGYAVNASMPFKGESINHLSEYINEDVFYAQWLTLQSRPMAVVGKFFDLSFINRFEGIDITVTVFKAANDVVSETEIITIENPGYGVIRVPLTISTGFDEYCIQASTAGAAGSGGVTSSISLPALSTFVNQETGDTDWTTGAAPNVVLPGAVGVNSSDQLVGFYSFIEGYAYEITVNVTRGATAQIKLEILDSSNNVLYSETETALSAGTGDEVFNFTAITGMVKISITAFRVVLLSTGTNTVTINTISGTQTTPVVAGISAQTLTEQICIDIVEECDTTYIAAPDEIRLTEDGDYRILE